MGTEPNDGERARALAEVARDYPGWQTWPGVLAGVVYARRPRTSPPLVVRAIIALGGERWCARRHGDPLRDVIHADTPGHLAEYITEAEAEP